MLLLWMLRCWRRWYAESVDASAEDAGSRYSEGIACAAVQVAAHNSESLVLRWLETLKLLCCCQQPVQLTHWL